MVKSMKMGKVNIAKTANTVMILSRKCTWANLCRKAQLLLRN